MKTKKIDKGFVYRDLKKDPATAQNFPALAKGGNGMQLVTLEPDQLLTPHWHPNSGETTYCLEGGGHVALVIPDATQSDALNAEFEFLDFCAGDVVFLPQGALHFFANPGPGPMSLLLTFDNPDFDILTYAVATTELPGNIKAALKLPKETQAPSTAEKPTYSPVKGNPCTGAKSTEEHGLRVTNQHTPY